MFKNQNFKYILLIVITYAIVFFASFFIRKILNAIIKKNTDELGAKETSYVFIKNSISFILYTIGTIYVVHNIPYLNSMSKTLFGAAGILAAVIGFASQKAFSNIVSGLFILIFKPFRVGDIIEISGNKKGIVEEITLRHTIIKDFEFRRVIIPNSIISDETIVNSSITDEKIRKHIEFNISYDSDINLARGIIRNNIRNHPLFIDNRTSEEIARKEDQVSIRLVKWGDYYVTLKAYVWTRNFDDSFNLTCDVLESVKKDFEEKGVEIPFPRSRVDFVNTHPVNK
ncbi:MAG: mechanosensitive ion channel family protein [Flavobacteriales bacterium]|jgi:small conductance mechanosensitive channel